MNPKSWIPAFREKCGQMVNLGNLATASERHIFANRALDLETLDRHNIESPRVPARLIVRNKANLQGVDARR